MGYALAAVRPGIPAARSRAACATVTWIGGPEDPLAYLAAGTSRLRVDRLGRWLLRIVDVAAALAARGYPPGLDTALALEVRDPLLPWNDGRFLLEIADGRGRASGGGAPGVAAAPVIALDARALATLYTGYLPPRALRDLGALEAEDDRALALATAAFAAGTRPWMADEFCRAPPCPRPSPGCALRKPGPVHEGRGEQRPRRRGASEDPERPGLLRPASGGSARGPTRTPA